MNSNDRRDDQLHGVNDFLRIKLAEQFSLRASQATSRTVDLSQRPRERQTESDEQELQKCQLASKISRPALGGCFELFDH